MTNEFSTEVLENASQYPSLGPVHFDAADISERYMAHFRAEHLAPLADMIAKEVRDRVWGDIDSWLLADTESNLQGECIALAGKIVFALLGSERHPAIDDMYLLGSGYEAEQVRNS